MDTLRPNMVAAAVMGFGVAEIPTFAWANKSGMAPSGLDEIEVRGQTIGAVKREFVRPKLQTWASIRQRVKVQEVAAAA